MDENLVTVKINENPIINLEITTYKNEANVNFLQSKGEKGEQGVPGVKGNDGITPDTDSFVNKSTTINNKALNSNIILTTTDINESTDKRYCTDTQKTIISNTSGINTGDETANTIKTKLGITTLSGSNTGDQDLSGFVVKTTTVNNKALSANVALTTADIADSTDKRYCTDAQKTSYDAAIANSHSHTNTTALNNIVNTGDGTQYLANDGTYKIISAGGLSYTAENVANKVTSLVDADNTPIVFTDDTQYPSAKAVSEGLDIATGALFDALFGYLTAEYMRKSFYYSNLVAYTLANVTSAQHIFGKGVALDANTLYRFRAVYHIGTGINTHTTSHGFAVTNTLVSCNYIARATSADLNTISTNINTVFVSGIDSKVLNATSSSATTIIQLEGTIRTNLETVLQPQIAFSDAPGATCQTYPGSFIELIPIGASTDVSSGTWS